MAHRPAHDPAKDIAPALIGRKNAVGDQESRGSKVIGDHPMARLALAGRRGAGQLRRSGDQGGERIGIVIVVDTLEDRGNPLEAHSGVDRGTRQVADDLIVLLLILHEDEIPDLGEAVAVLIRRSRRPAWNMLAMIVENLRTGTARAIVAHRPEIVLGRDPDDPALRKTGDLPPQIERFVVGMVDGRRQPVRADTPFAGDQLPGEGDRLFLEIVAEREIAEHLEECVVAGSVADIVEIVVLAAGANALLR